jgi:hypothetical protein
MGSTKISQPETPAAPSTADAINAWVKSMPEVYETQMKYAPLEAAQQVQLASQYALPYAQAMKTAQDTLYPETAKIQEQLANEALQGANAGLSDAERKMYRDTLVSELGTNVGSPIGADYTSRGLLSATQNRQDYYRNLALSLAGRSPLATANTPQTTNYMGGYTPQSVMNYTGQNYGNYANAYSSMYGANAQLAGQKNSSTMGLIGSGLGAVGSIGAAMMM